MIAAVLVVSAGIVPMQAADAEHLAYSVGKKSRAPFPEQIVDVESRYMLNVEWGEYRGSKTRLALLPASNSSPANSVSADNPAASGDFMAAGTGVPLSGIEALAGNVIEQTGRFELLTYVTVSGGSAATQGDAAATNASDVDQAEFLLQLIVTDYVINAEEKKGEKGKITGKVPFLGGPKGGSWVGLNLRLIDMTNKNVVFSRQVEGIIRRDDLSVSPSRFDGVGHFVGFASAYTATPIGQAVIAALTEGVFELVKHVGGKTPEGAIVKVDGEQIYTNLGDNMVAAGDLLQVVRAGEELFDPTTGASLGASVTPLGVIEVTLAEDMYSVTRPVSMNSPVDRGDKVVATRAPEPHKFAKKWKKPK